MMKKILLACLICLVLSAASPGYGQSLSKCFRAEWLQGERGVNLTIKGNKVSGAFTVGSDDHSPDKSYDFTGTRRGNTFTVAFAGNELPNVAPSEMKSLVWTLVRVRGRELLRIKFYGKNYDTNKYENSFAYFEPCVTGYERYAKTARTIHFAKGAKSATVRLDSLAGFQDGSTPATFLMSAFKRQVLEINAAGCSIQLYLPNKEVFELIDSLDNGEDTTTSFYIDTMSTGELPQSGTYLVLLRKSAENTHPKRVTFKVMN
jgi:hypothetical protein